MIPSRTRLSRWNFAPITTAAATITTRGNTIETTATDIEGHCGRMPALREWSGSAHDAANSAFRRSKTSAVVISDLSDTLSRTLTAGYWTLSTAKRNVMGKVTEIEGNRLVVQDIWAITLKPEPMSQSDAKALIALRDSYQLELSPLVTAMGRADDSVATSLAAAAATAGFQMPNDLTMLAVRPPADDVPDPSSIQGALALKLIANADAAATVTETTKGKDAQGRTVVTVYMQDGSRIVRTDLSMQSFDEVRYDSNGQKVTTTSVLITDRGRHQNTTFHTDGTRVETSVYFDGTTRGVLFPQGDRSNPQKLEPEFFAHPTATALGGGLSAADTAADNMTKKFPTDKLFSNIRGGAKFGGIGLATAVALYDVSTAETPGQKCQAAISGIMSVAGGYGGGVAGGAIPVPGLNVVAAGVGSIAGSWLAGYVGSQIGKAVCY